MNPLFTVDVNGREIACIATLIDGVENQEIPNRDTSDTWESFLGFVTQRAQSTLGKWPVRVISEPAPSFGPARFTGYRVFAKCFSLSTSKPSIIEYGILVWHMNEVPITLSPVVRDLNWSTFAEAVEM